MALFAVKKNRQEEQVYTMAEHPMERVLVDGSVANHAESKAALIVTKTNSKSHWSFIHRLRMLFQPLFFVIEWVILATLFSALVGYYIFRWKWYSLNRGK